MLSFIKIFTSFTGSGAFKKYALDDFQLILSKKSIELASNRISNIISLIFVIFCTSPLIFIHLQAQLKNSKFDLIVCSFLGYGFFFQYIE
jgi:hypothetical protein